MALAALESDPKNHIYVIDVQDANIYIKVPLTIGSGPGTAKYMWIWWIRIWNTTGNDTEPDRANPNLHTVLWMPII